MRLLSLILIMLLSVCAYAEVNQKSNENVITVKKSQEFTGSITPDKLYTRLVFTILEKNYADASKVLDRLSKTLKRYEDICKNGGYYITKAFSWDSAKRKNLFAGYNGRVDIQCTYDKVDDIEKLYNEPYIKKLINNNKRVTFSNLGTRWIVSKAANLKKKDELETDAVLYGSIFADKLSTLLKKRCKSKVIELSPTGYEPIPRVLQERVFAGASSNAIKAVSPSKEDAVIKYLANYTFECN